VSCDDGVELNVGVRLAHQLLVQAPAERVWALTEDIESWPRLTPTMRRVERLDDGPLRVGSTATVTQPRLRPARWRVTELEPPRRFVWETETLGTRIVAGHHVEPAGEGCRNTLTLDVTGRGATVLGGLAGRALRSALATENDGFRRAAEGLERPRFVDEHRTTVPASPDRAWQAVRQYAAALASRQPSRAVAGLLDLEPAPGFEIREELPPRLLSLGGRHRFSRYALDFRLAAADGGATVVSAVSYADFPGPHGLAYRTVVVGSRGHVLAVRRMLDRIRALA
jgi:carbon monoxide dehydrogenase subunit G